MEGMCEVGTEGVVVGNFGLPSWGRGAWLLNEQGGEQQDTIVMGTSALYVKTQMISSDIQLESFMGMVSYISLKIHQL